MRRAWLSSVLAASACAEPGSAWSETEHLRVRGYAGAELCAGTAPLLEREVVRLLDALRLPEPEEAIDVVLGPDAARGCSSGYAGCAGRLESGRVTVISPYEHVTHELVHAVRLSAGVRGPSFYEEGLAEAFAAGVVTAREIPGASGDASEIDALQLERLQEYGAYAIAASFVSWLRSETDARAFAEAFAGPPYAEIETRDELETWFASAFGRSLADAEAAWVEDAAEGYVRPGPCLDNERIVLVGGRAEESGRLDCGDEGTIGPSSPDGMEAAEIRSITRCADVAGASRVVLQYEGAASTWLDARVRRCESHVAVGFASVRRGETAEVMIEPEDCWLDLRVVGPTEVATEYRWAVDVR